MTLRALTAIASLLGLLAPLAASGQASPPRGGEQAQERHAHGAEWGYAGPSGPEHWAELGAQYRVCSTSSQCAESARRALRSASLPVTG